MHGRPQPLAAWLGVLLMLAVPGACSAARAATAPDFAGITHWVNSPPLVMQDLRGKVVLVDFWAFECINCQHVQPHLNALYERYRDRGLVVVGVHTPELPAERNLSGLVAAVRRYGIRYPVAQDNHGDTWAAWSNRYWPSQYLVGAQGDVVFTHIGEGGYAAMENAVRVQLGLPPLGDPSN